MVIDKFSLKIRYKTIQFGVEIPSFRQYFDFSIIIITNLSRNVKRLYKEFKMKPINSVFGVPKMFHMQ